MPDALLHFKPKPRDLPSDDLEVTFDFDELKQLYISANNGERVVWKRINRNLIDFHKTQWLTNYLPAFTDKKTGRKRPAVPGFFGATSMQMIEWLHNGYRSDSLNLESHIKSRRKRRRLLYSDEGELQVDLALSGYDNPYLSWTHKEVVPGLKVEIYSAFNVTTQYNVIQQYYQFILRTFVMLEESGVDLELNFVSEVDKLLINAPEKKTKINIRLKREGELADFTSWSPMFSPGGHRHLAFLSYIKAADTYGSSAASNLGLVTNLFADWGIKYDRELGVLQFMCPGHDSIFPEEKMRTMLMEALKGYG